MNADEAASRARGIEAAQAAQRRARAVPKPRPTQCDGCGAPITQRYGKGCKTRKWCSRKCSRDTHRRRQRAARRMEAFMQRPRCVICDTPLPYGKRGHRLANVTCSRKCSIKRWNWFKRGSSAA